MKFLEGTKILGRWLRSALGLAMHILVDLLIGGVILVGAMMLFLAQKPVSIDWLLPYVGHVLPLEAQEATVLWHVGANQIELQVNDARLHLEPDQPQLHARDLSVRLGLLQLFRGQIKPRRIDLDGLVLHIKGTESESRPEPGGDDVSSPGEALDVLMDALALVNPDGPFALLDSLAVQRVDLRYEQPGTEEKSWHIPDATLRVSHDEGMVMGHMHFDLAVGDTLSRISADLTVDRRPATDPGLDLLVSVNRLSLSALAGQLPELGALTGVNMAVSGWLQARFNPDYVLESVRFDMQSPQGHLILPENLPQPLSFREVLVAGVYDARKPRLQVTEISAKTGPAVWTGTVELSDLTRAPKLTLDLHVDNLFFDYAKNNWPMGASPAVHEWLTENVEAGRISTADIRGAFDLTLPTIPLAIGPSMAELPTTPDRRKAGAANEGEGAIDLSLRDISGTLAIDNTVVHYLKPLPPLTGVSGRGMFNPDSVTLFPERGRIGNLVVNGGRIDFTNLSVGSGERARIEVDAETPLTDLLVLLDKKPLEFISDMGVAPKDVTGRTGVNVVLSFPLLADLPFEKVDVGVGARVEKLTARKIAGQFDLANGAMTMQLTGQGLQAQGRVDIDGVPSNLFWRERFGRLPAEPNRLCSTKKPERRRFVVRNRVKPDWLARHGVDLRRYAKGPAAVRAVYSAQDDDTACLSFSADLKDNHLILDGIEWQKPPGKPGRARGVVQFHKGFAQTLSPVRLVAGDLEARARLWLHRSGAIKTVDLQAARLGPVAGRGFLYNRAFTRPVQRPDAGFGPQAERWALTLTGSGPVPVLAPDGAPVRLEGALSIDSKGFLRTTELPVLEIGGKEYTLSAQQVADEREVVATLTGDTFDAAPLLTQPEAESPEGRAFDLTARFDRVLLGDSRPLTTVDARMVRNRKGWIRWRIAAAQKIEDLEGPALIRRELLGGLTGTPDDREKQKQAAAAEANRPSYLFLVERRPDGILTLQIPNAGDSLRAYQLINTVLGGRMTFRGQLAPREPRFVGDFEGKLRIKGFRVTDTPFISRLVDGFSLIGLTDAFVNRGQPFSQLDALVRQQGAKTTFSKGFLHGTGIGGTFQGIIDKEARNFDLSGTITPLYLLNRFLDEMPILSLLLGSGDEDEGGSFAADWRFQGPFDSPEMSVNPLTVLAPGFLRRLIHAVEEDMEDPVTP